MIKHMYNLNVFFPVSPSPSKMAPSFEPWAESAAAPPTAAQNKKPRHRHSPVQLAALNELFDQNEHPPLDQRTALADRLGMYVSPLSSLCIFSLQVSGRQRQSMPGFRTSGPPPRSASVVAQQLSMPHHRLQQSLTLTATLSIYRSLSTTLTSKTSIRTHPSISPVHPTSTTTTTTMAYI